MQTGGLRIRRTLFGAISARTTTFAAGEDDGIRINRVPAVGACAAVHRNHFNAGRRGNVRRARVDRDKQIRTSKKFSQIRQRSFAAEIFHVKANRVDDFVGVIFIVRRADNEKCRVVNFVEFANDFGEIFFAPRLERESSFDTQRDFKFFVGKTGVSWPSILKNFRTIS